MTIAYLFRPAPLLAIAAGAVAVLVIALAFLRHQRRTWMRVARALPMSGDAR